MFEHVQGSQMRRAALFVTVQVRPPTCCEGSARVLCEVQSGHNNPIIL
jgi:hypothetical protein